MLKNVFDCFSGNPYFRATLSSLNAVVLSALNVSESDIGSGYAEHGDGGDGVVLF